MEIDKCGHKKGSRWTIKQVKYYARNYAYDVADDEFLGVKYKISIICDNGHTFSMRWHQFYTLGHRCPTCSVNRKRLASYRYIKKHVELQGYHLLSEDYMNNTTKLKMVCPNSHLCDIPWQQFHSGNRCAECSGNKKLTIRIVERFVRLNNYEILSDKYINAHSKLKLRCPEKHIFYMSHDSFKQGRRCPQCAKSGFDSNKSAILYYLRVVYKKRKYYKIGITNRSIKERYNHGDLKKIVVLEEWAYNIGKDGYNKEKDLLIKFSKFRYRGKDKILKDGNTELFIYDILGLDNQRGDTNVYIEPQR